MVKQTRSKQKIQNKKSKRKKKSESEWIAKIMQYAYENELVSGYHEQNNHHHNWKFVSRPKSQDLDFYWFKCSCCGIVAVGKKKDKYFPNAYTYYCQPKDNLTCDEVMVKDILT